MRKFSLTLLVSILALCMCFSVACTQVPTSDAPSLTAGEQTLGEAKKFTFDYTIGSGVYGAQLEFDNLPQGIKVSKIEAFSGDTKLDAGTQDKYLYLKHISATNMAVFYIKRDNTSLESTPKIDNLKLTIEFTAADTVLVGTYQINTTKITKTTSVGTTGADGKATVDIVNVTIDNVNNSITLAR